MSTEVTRSARCSDRMAGDRTAAANRVHSSWRAASFARDGCARRRSAWDNRAVAARPEVPAPWVRRLRTLLVDRFPECVEENAWVGVRWRVGQATVAHVFGGEDGLFRITFRADSDEVMAFRHLGHPY